MNGNTKALLCGKQKFDNSVQSVPTCQNDVLKSKDRQIVKQAKMVHRLVHTVKTN